MIKKYFLFLVFGFLIQNLSAQKIATFEIELSKPANGLDVPVNIDLDDITFIKDSSLSLVKVDGNKKTAAPFQIRNGEHRTIYFLIKPGNKQQKKYTYQLINAIPTNFNEIIAENKDGALTI